MIGEGSTSFASVSSLVEALEIEEGRDESWEREEEARDVYVDIVSDKRGEIRSDRWRCSLKLSSGFPPDLSAVFSATFPMISKGGMCSGTPLMITKAKACQNEGECLRIGYLNVPSARLALSLSNIQL